MFKELKGECKNCVLGCGRLENLNFVGIEKCEYAISR